MALFIPPLTLLQQSDQSEKTPNTIGTLANVTAEKNRRMLATRWWNESDGDPTKGQAWTNICPRRVLQGLTSQALLSRWGQVGQSNLSGRL